MALDGPGTKNDGFSIRSLANSHLAEPLDIPKLAFVQTSGSSDLDEGDACVPRHAER